MAAGFWVSESHEVTGFSYAIHTLMQFVLVSSMHVFVRGRCVKVLDGGLRLKYSQYILELHDYTT